MNLKPLYEEAIQFNNFNGTVLAAGKVEVWYLGRTRKADIYADVAGETPLPNPFDLNNLGMQQVYVNPAFNYTLVVYDPYGSELFSIDKYLQGAGVHTTSNVVVQPSENIGVSAWTVGEVQIYQPYLIGDVGKTYEGIEPIVVNNDVNRISANHVALGLQEPLFFAQDDENGCVIGCSAQTEIPSSVSSKWEDASDTVSNNSAQWGIGTVYTPGNYIDINDDVISVTGLQPAGDYAYNSALSSKLDTTAFSTVSGNFLTAVDLTPYQEKSAMTGYLTTGDSAQFITALPEDLVYTGDLNDYAKKDFVLSSIDSSTSGLLPTSSFSSVSGSFLTALPSDLVYTADITGKLDTSVYATDSAMFSGAIDYVSANVGGSVTSPLGTILVNGSEIEGTNSAINLTGHKTPHITASNVNIAQTYKYYPLNFGTINTGSILTISGGDGNVSTLYVTGYNSANAIREVEFKNLFYSKSASLGDIVSGLSVVMDDGGRTGNYNFELSSYTLGSGVNELAWKTDLNDSYEYIQANYQTQSAMTAYQPQSAMTGYMSTNVAFSTFQRKHDMTAYQPAGDYLTTADSAQFITALPVDLVYTADITGFATTADLTSKLDKSDSANFLLTGDSANFYTTANESGFLVADDITGKLDTSIYAANSANWDSTYNTVSTNSASWTATTIPDEVMSAASAVSSNSATWDSVSSKLDESGLEYDGDKISGYNGSAFAGGDIELSSYVPYSALEVPLGTNNIASYTGFAQGANNRASYRSFAQGTNIRSIDWSFAQGDKCSAGYYSIAQGVNNSAYMYSQAFGIGTKIANTGMAIGGYNKTISGVSFVVGNGNSTGNRSDAFIIYPNGSVSAAGNISANGVELGAGGGGSVPDEVMSAASAVSSNSATWNETTDTLSANSAAWGGSALPISAGPGVKMELVDNTLVFSNDETVLYTANAASNTIVLSEKATNFERLRLELQSYQSTMVVNYTEVKPNDNYLTFFAQTLIPAATYPLQILGVQFSSTNGITYNMSRGVRAYYKVTSDWSGNDSTDMTSNIKDAGYITKIIGINRIAGV